MITTVMPDKRRRRLALSLFMGLWLRSVTGLVQEGHLAEEVEVGPAEHESLDVLEFAVCPFDGSAVPVEGESVADGVAVVAEAAGEGVELGLLVLLLGGLEPVVEAVAVQAGEDFRELGDVAGEGAEVGAGGGGAGEAGLAVVVEAGGVGEDPAGDVAGSGRGGGGGRERAVAAEGPQVAADRAVAAAVAEGPCLGVQGGGAAAALVPAPGEVGFVGVEGGRAGAPGAEGGGEDLVGARGAGVEADGGAGQPGVPGDRGGRVALGGQLPDLLVAFADAAGQGLVRPGPRGGGGRRGRGRALP